MKRRTLSEWRSLIAVFEASGQTQAAFCEARGLNPNYFSQRRSQLKAGGEPAFVRAVKSAPVPAEPIMLHIGNVRVQWRAEMGVAALAELIRALA